MGHNPSYPVTSEDAEGQCGPHSTSPEVSGMVPSTPNPSSGLSMPVTSQEFNNPPGSHNSLAHQGPQSTAGCMAYIRKSCEERHLSKEATARFMTSWQTKSQSNYHSLFHKWECWYHEWDKSPIQGPVMDVSIFLTELYGAKYSYCSLDSYCSAISSVHEEVDGHLVQQHPMVARILKGALNSRPPKPRYTSARSVKQAITLLDR